MIRLERKVTKGRLGDMIFQFNPSTITYGGGATWNTVSSAGGTKPITQYGTGLPDVFNFELWMSERTFVGVDAKAQMDLLDSYRKSKSSVVFVYAGFSRRVVITECTIEIEELNKELKPIGFRATIALQEFN